MEKIKKLFKMKGIGFILLAFAAGIILLILPSGDGEKEAESFSSANYAFELEERLSKLLKSACGKNCLVMITLDCGYPYSYAANEKLDTEYEASGLTSKTVSKEYAVISKNGSESLVILKENLPKVKGVAVVCKGGGEAERLKILTLVSALFGLEADAVSCVTMS